MQKIVLCGERNHVLNQIDEVLREHFEIQTCTGDVAALKIMIAAMHPQMIVVNLFGTKTVNTSYVSFLAEKSHEIGILILAKEVLANQLQQADPDRNFRILSAPIRISHIFHKCNELLGTSLALPAPSADDSAHEKTIMVVDDSPLFFRNTKRILDGEYKVIYANSGEKALTQLATNKTDVIILDYEMPDMNGAQTYQKIKENPANKDIPIIFLTATSHQEKVRELLSLYPFGYILKPLNPEKVKSMVDEAFEWKSDTDRIIVK